MEVLDQSVLPQSPHHLILIKYLLNLSYILFIPYVSVLCGSLLFSLYFKRKSNLNKDDNYKSFSKKLIDLPTFNKSIAFALGAVPLLSSMFGHAQILHSSGSSIPFYIFLSFILLIVSFFFIYTYKYTFHLNDIFESFDVKSKNGEIIEDKASYSSKTGLLNKRSGIYGLIFLLLSIYVYLGTIQLANNNSIWTDGFLTMILSFTALISFLQFIVASLVLTSILVLYYFFRTNSEAYIQNEEFKSSVKILTLTTSLLSIIALALLMSLSVFLIPSKSFSYEYFVLSTIILLFLLLIASLIYVMVRESSVKYSISIFYLVILVFILSIIKDQYTLEISTKMQTILLAKEYDAYIAKIEEASGVVVTISGADIYNGRCIACHNFDKKVVGPPYKETLPKYERKKDDLIKFILNPVKKNPNYPAMPNQGLKQKEAEAVADYIMNTYKK